MSTQTLIADDSLMIRKIIKKALLGNTIEHYSFEEQNIYEASDGMEAFELIGKNRGIKLIISDINMPNLNGDEFIEILQDTGKLEGMEIVFITSTSTKLHLKEEIREKILGVIYKPFRYDDFNEQLLNLREEKKRKELEQRRIKKLQVEHKKHINEVCSIYINEFSLELKKSLLSTLIDEVFGQENISKNDYQELAYAILSMYMFELSIEHEINSKKILCIFRSFEKKVKLSENRFSLIDGFKDQIAYVNSNELKPEEILEELSKSLADKISIASIFAKKYPRYKLQLFAPFFSFIIEEFSRLDCDFLDTELEKLLIEQREIIKFNRWMYNFFEKRHIDKIVSVSKSPRLKAELSRRLKNIYKLSHILSEHYCAQIDSYIWRRVKESSEISRYLKKNLSNRLFTTSNFLLQSGKIDNRKYKEYLPYEKKSLVVVSDDLDRLSVFKNIVDPPFENWNFSCFTKLKVLDAWMKNNKADKIIVDYSMRSTVFENGIQFLKLLIKRYPVYKSIVKNHQVFIIAPKDKYIELNKYKKAYNFTIIDESLEVKELYKTLMYN